jgi:flagellar hook assembly protein FlgD
MKNLKYFYLVALLAFSCISYAQMQVGSDVLHGSEWINPSKEYFKIKVGEDGVYKVNKKVLESNGFWKNGMDINKVALYNFGKQSPIFVSSPNFGNDDYLIFYGEKNKLGLDSFLYDNKNEILNENVSLFTDTSIYFLVYEPELETALRYTEVKPNYGANTLAASPFYMHTSRVDFMNRHYKPIIGGSQNFQFSWIVSSEGFVNQLVPSETINLKLDNHYKNFEGKVEVKLNVANSVEPNNKETTFNGEVVSKDVSERYGINKIQFEVDNKNLTSDNTLKIQEKFNKFLFGVSSLQLKYPRLFDFEKVGLAKWESNQAFFAKLTNTDKSSVVLDLKNNEIVTLNSKDNGLAELLIEDDKSRTLVLSKKPIEVNELFVFKPLNTKNIDPKFLIISSRRLKNSSPIDEIENYRKYRESAEGGNLKSSVIYAEDIYDQFGYGVPNHTMAFKNLSHYAESNWKNLEYIFIIGKGRAYSDVRFRSQLASLQTESFYVPTFGSPPSDIMLFSKGNTIDTKFAIGRIAAANMEDVGNYLAKIKVHEQVLKTENPAWTKNIMHLGGGDAGGQRNEIATRLRQMEEIISKPLFGGRVSTYFKDNSSTVQIANLPKIKADINGGLGIINFFGHAAVGTFDFTLDDPSNYENEGRLPFMFSLGCYSGNICTNGRGISENFVLNKGKGATGYIAAAGTAFIHTQANFGLNFYSKLSSDFYDKPVGKLLQAIEEESHKNYSTSGYRSANYDVLTLSQQLILHSDPALRIWGFEKPDFTIDPISVRTVENVVNQSKDSFEIMYTVQNLRRGVNDSITILITHTNQDGKVINTLKQRIIAPPYDITMKAKLNLRSLDIIGLNKIFIEVDADKQVNEENETNNGIMIKNDNFYSFYILPEDVVTSYPLKFAIVNDPEQFELIASTANAFGKEDEYIFQIDTTINFNSPYLKEQIIRTGSALIKWKPEFELLNNRAYYWRVAMKKINSNIPVSWSNSTFSYVIGEPEGWRQQHQYQYAENQLEYMTPLERNDFKFERVEQLINVRSQIYTDNLNEPLTIVNSSKNSGFSPFRGASNTLNVIVWKRNGILKNVTRTDYNSEAYGNNVFPFDLSKEGARLGLRKLLDNAPDSSMIIIFAYYKSSQADYGYTKWLEDTTKHGFTIYNTMEDYGAKKFNQFSSGPKTYIYLFQKGVGPVSEKVGQNIFEQIDASTSVDAIGFFGKMKAEIGPAKKWNSLSWNWNFKPLPIDEYVYHKMNVYKIDRNNNKILHAENVDSKYDLSKLDASLYPKIMVEYDVVDYYSLKPAIINDWTVNYQGLSDYTIDLKNNIPDTIDQGDIINIEGFAGINDFHIADSVNIRYSLVNSKNERLDKIATLNLSKQGNTAFVSSFDTKDLSGLFQLFATINYDNKIPENVTHNNSGQKMIYIRPDKINPVLDITFDGIRILDGDLVAANPNIVITVKDENKRLLINNKKAITYTLKNTSKNTQVVLSDADVKVELPISNATNNVAKLILLPKLQDGDYELSSNASDYAGNSSGDYNYTVRFKVVSKKSISNLVNYPNPFSNNTKFIFDLTGEIPQNMKILIMTISGKVVREITAAELGPIKIGRNMTEYSWNGTDEFGDKLANGVYLYKLMIPNNKDFEIGQEFTTGGFGKMMIVR